MNWLRAVYGMAPGFVRREMRRRLPRGVGDFELRLGGGARLTLSSEVKSTVVANLWWDGMSGYEAETLSLFAALSKEAGTVYDVGAYFGLYSLVTAATNPQAAVHAFEPFPQSRRLVEHLVRLNGFEKRITIHPEAVSDALGEASYYFPADASGRVQNIGSLHNRFAEGERFAEREAEELRVPVTTIDEAVKSGLPTPNLMKVDVEETEHLVLKGAMETLGEAGPDIVLEIIFDRSEIVAMEDRLRERDYRFFDIFDGEVRELPSLTAPKEDRGEERLHKRRGGATDRLLSRKSTEELNDLLS